jgi:hypothetical protein
VFEKFRQKKRIEAIAQSPIGKMLDQVALATAVAQITGDYVRSRNGLSILKDEDASIVEMWSGVRLEAISQLWGPGPNSLELIIDPAKHPSLLDAFIERSNSYLYGSQSAQNEIDGTISAILRIYDVLAQMEIDVCSPYLQTYKQNKGYVAPYAGLVEEMRKLHIKWQGFIFAVHTKANFLPAHDICHALARRDVQVESHRSMWPSWPPLPCKFCGTQKEGRGGQRKHQGPRRPYH